MSEGVLRIRKLLEHWIEHNEEHLARFREVAADAEGMGLADAAGSLRVAADRGEDVSAQLRKALESMG